MAMPYCHLSCPKTEASLCDVCWHYGCPRILPSMRAPPRRVGRLPDQYFGALLARVAAAARVDAVPLLDLGRGNPETGPAPYVVDVLTASAQRPDAHGYTPFRGLPELREALAERYHTHYGVELDADTEVAVVSGTKTAIIELSLVLADEGQT